MPFLTPYPRRNQVSPGNSSLPAFADPLVTRQRRCYVSAAVDASMDVYGNIHTSELTRNPEWAALFSQVWTLRGAVRMQLRFSH